jgi:hypothetical protein
MLAMLLEMTSTLRCCAIIPVAAMLKDLMGPVLSSRGLPASGADFA